MRCVPSSGRARPTWTLRATRSPCSTSSLAARLRRRLTTVVDTLGLDASRRQGYLAAARAAGMRAVAVVVDTPERLCRARNRERARPVPAPALAAQLRKVRELDLAAEGWDEVRRIDRHRSRAGGRRVAGACCVACARTAFRAAALALRVGQRCRGSGALVGRCRARRGGRRLPGTGGDGPSHPDPAGRAAPGSRSPNRGSPSACSPDCPPELELGTLVSPLSLHTPGRLAKAAATLDALSGGRAFCGVGAGWWEREHLAFGLPFGSADDRVAALRAAIPVLRALWAPGTKPAAGLPETTNYPRPVGDLPLLVGGRSARVLQIAAELGDGCNVPATEQHVTRAAALVQGKRITVLDVPVLGRDRDDVAALVERLRGRATAAAYAAQPPRGDRRRPRRALPHGSPGSGSTRCSSRSPTCATRATWPSSPP